MEWRPVSKGREREESGGDRTLSTEQTRTTERTRTTDLERRPPHKEKDVLGSVSGKTITSAAAEKRNDVQTRPDNEFEPERIPTTETEEERRHHIRGKAIVEEINVRETFKEPARVINGTLRLAEPILNKILENQELLGEKHSKPHPPVDRTLMFIATEAAGPSSKRVVNIQDCVVELNKTGDNGKHGTVEDNQLMSEE